MYNVNLTADDVRALDKIKDIPAALREHVEQIKKTLPVSVELPRDFYEDMQRRAVALHSTPELLIVQFCRRWISTNSDTISDMSKVGETGNKSVFYPVTPKADCLLADDDKCAHYDCTHRKEVQLPPIVLSEKEEPHTPAQSVKDDTRQALANIMKEREISSAEFAWYVGVSPHTIASFIRGNNIGAALCANIAATVKKIESGELRTNNFVAECVIPERITKYKKSHNMSNSDIGALIGYSETTVHRLCHGMPVSNPVYRKVRDFFKI